MVGKCKEENKRFCVEHSKSRKLSFHNKLLKLSVKLRELLHNNSAIDEIKRIREETKSLNEKKLQGVKVRARVKHFN